MMAAAAGFVLSAGVAVLIYLLDRTIKGEDDIQSFSISYLGEVPEMVEARSGKRKRRKKKTALLHCGICCSVQKIFRFRARKLTAPSAPT